MVNCHLRTKAKKDNRHQKQQLIQNVSIVGMKIIHLHEYNFTHKKVRTGKSSLLLKLLLENTNF